MRKQVQVTISVGRSEPLTTAECTEIAEAFKQACPMFISRLRQGAQMIPLTLQVGSDDVVEKRCRVCNRSESELLALGIELKPFDPSVGGVRPVMEAALPSDRIIYYDCGCAERAAKETAEANRKELARRTPVGPPHLPVRSQAQLESDIADLKAALARLGGH